MDPMTVAAGITALGGLVSAGTGVANWISQDQAYKDTKQYQQKTWKREDNAVQRRVADLKRAGINPVLAAGQAASTSSPVHLTPPQLDGVGEGVSQAGMAGLNALRMKQDIAQSNTQIAMNLAATKKTELDAARAALEYDARQYDINHFKELGLATNSTGLAAEIANVVGAWKKNGTSFGNAVNELADKVAPVVKSASDRARSAGQKVQNEQTSRDENAKDWIRQHIPGGNWIMDQYERW